MTIFHLVKLFRHPASSISETKKLFKTTRWAVKNLTWVDETRIGVIGTNYGGFLALLTDRWMLFVNSYSSDEEAIHMNNVPFPI